MKRALIILSGALLLALFLVAGTAVFLAATESGTRFLAGQAERFVPVRFTNVSGALLRQIRIGKLEVLLENQRLEVEVLAASVEMMPLLFDNHLIVHSLSADSVTLSSTGGTSDTSPPPVLQLPYMPLDIDAAALTIERLVLPGVFPMRVAGSASWREDGLTVHSLNVTSEAIAGTLTGRLGTGANPILTAQVNWSLPDQAWGGAGHLDGRVDSLAVQHVLRGYVSVDAEGQGSLADVTRPFVDLAVGADDLEFGDTAVRNISGRVRGTPANVSADLSSVLSTPGIEPFRVDVVAYGPANGPLTVRNVSADALGGAQEAQGSVAWADGVRVLLGGTVRDVELARLREGLTGRVSSGFEFRYQDGLLGLGLGDISGTFNQRPIGGAVEIVQLEEGWGFDPVRLTVGRNRLSGTATLSGATLKLRGDIDAPALEALGLGVSGDASGSVHLSGAWPDLSGSLALTSARLEGFGAALNQSVVDARLTGGELDSTVTVQQASRQQLTVDQAQLSAAGPMDDLDWHLAWAGGEGSGELRRGGERLEVAVTSARMQFLDEQWVLREPTRVLMQGERIEVSPVCITGGGASACLQQLAYRAGRIETRGELERAPVALFNPWLPVSLGEGGYLEGGWSLAGAWDNLDGELSLAARQLSYVVGEQQDDIELPDLEAEGDLVDGALRMHLAATDQAFSLVGDAHLEPLQQNGTLSGTIEASATDLSPLKVFDQRLEEVAGNVQGKLEISGTLATPRLQGQFRLADGRLRLNDPGITLSRVEVRLNMDDSGTFDLRGTAIPGDAGEEGESGDELVLTASGSGLFEEAMTIYAGLEGENLRAGHPDWEISVSPDLNLAYENGRGWVRGRVELPEAEVRLTALPTSVPSPSEDVVVVGREADRSGEDNRIRADVEVVLGDDVTLKALGITAELEGSLRARLDAQGQTTLRGTVGITGGELTTQGQTLTIESGSVVYNGPVTSPYIDLRAVRVIEDQTPEVRVGLHIRGDANNLTSTVFSEPAMSETRALSFLVLGRDIEEETAGDDSSRLVAAAINLGLSRSKGITSELMRMTGLDELSASAEAEDSFAIVAGKRITDDIYVRYTYNTLSAVGAFLVRYDLSRKWQLEAYSGEQSAMDILYSVEK